MVRLQARTAACVGSGDLRECTGAGRGLALDGQQSAGEEEVEIVLGRGEHGVVRGRLHIGLAGGHNPLGGLRRENGV